jgi:hypothetical protein
LKNDLGLLSHSSRHPGRVEPSTTSQSTGAAAWGGRLAAQALLIYTAIDQPIRPPSMLVAA